MVSVLVMVLVLMLLFDVGVGVGVGLGVSVGLEPRDRPLKGRLTRRPWKGAFARCHAPGVP